MGLLTNIKTSMHVKKVMKRMDQYLHMTRDELISLPDDELIDAIFSLLTEEGGNMDPQECLAKFRDAKKVLYVVDAFDSEVQDEGLYHYLSTSKRLTAPYILECLDMIGALPYKDLLQGFIDENNISLDNLEAFADEETDEYELLAERYPFDDFDEAYEELCENDSLYRYVLDYAKLHLDELL